MATNISPGGFRIPQEPLPVPVMNEVEPVPLFSSDSQSFVVIRSAEDLDDLSDDNEIADISILQEHKQLIQEELAEFESSPSYPQPSLANFHSLPENKPSMTTKESVSKNAGSIQKDSDSLPENSGSVSKDSSKTLQNTVESMPNRPKLSDEATNASDMNQSALPAMPQPQVDIRMDADDHDQRAISIVSFAPSDFGSEEIQAKVTQLIDENMHLKDTIIQNNLSMRAHYDKIVAWQQDVERVHESHKEKFREAKRCIETLKEENACLKQDNDNLRYTLQIQKTENDKTKQLLTETTENNLKEFELDVANKKIKELEQAVSKLNIQKDDLASDTEKWKRMEEKLQRYEKELENAYKQIRDLKSAGEKEQSELGKLQRYEKELETAYKQIRDLRSAGEREQAELGKLKLTQEKLLISEMANDRSQKEIESLRNQLARNMQTTDDTSRIQLALDQALAERDRLIVDLASRNATVMDSHSRCKKLEQELQEANDMLRKHQGIVRESKEKEEQAKIEAWMTKQKLAEMEQKLQFVQMNLEAAQQVKPQYVVETNPGELAYIRQQLMQSQKTLTESEQNRAVADAQLQAMKNQNAELRNQLDAKLNADDDLMLLRAQLDVYKTDFEAEQAAKEEVKRAKNKMAEDLQHMNRRNQQLQEEIELLTIQLQQFGSFPRSNPRTSKKNEDGGGSDKNDYIYKCPKCNFGFKTVQAVENHVVRCIELDDALP